MPTRWEAANVRWKTPIPGLAHSSPVVWGDRVFITTAVSLNADAAFKTQTDDNDPVIENTRYSWRIYCLNQGYASSPIIWKDLAIVQCDGHAQSFLAAFDLKSGSRVWSAPRGEMPSWSSPVVYRGRTRDELITNAPRFIRAYDPLTGRELWRFANGDRVVQVPAPFIANDLIYLTGGWPGGHPIKVLKPGASGDISVKEEQRSGPYDQSIGFSASPVAGDGKLFLASEDGDVYVIKAGPVYELIAVNPMGEAMIATPAISGGLLIVRGQHHVFGIGGK